MIITASIVVPILNMDENLPEIRNKSQELDLHTLLTQGYRIKIVNDFLYHDVIFAHYILEKEE